MPGDRLTFDAVQATWLQLPEPARTAISAALVATADAEVSKLDSFWPASYGDSPRVDVLGVLADSAGTRRVHFIAHALNYNNAQSGSDWADHYLFVGDVVLGEGDVLGEARMRLVRHDALREAEWERYRASRLVEEVRDRAIADLGVVPPVPEMETITIVRCPSCGATDAGATEHMFEIVRMTCGASGHEELVDDFQIKDDWNVRHERRKDDNTLPDFVEPLPSEKAGFELRGDASDEGQLLVHPGLGYSIALPGRSWNIGPRDAQTAIVEVNLWVRVVVRADRLYTMGTRDELLRRELEGTARHRATQGSAFELVEVTPVPGAAATMTTTYPRFVDDEATTELCAISVKGEHPNYDAVVAYISYPTRRLGDEAWKHVRDALLDSQRWTP